MAGSLTKTNFSTKDHEGAWWGHVGTHAQSQEQPKGSPLSQDVLTENKTAETCVVVIVSFFTQFQKETIVTQLQRLSTSSSNSWVYCTTQQSWTE